MKDAGFIDTQPVSAVRTFVAVVLMFEVLSWAMHDSLLRSLPGAIGAGIGVTGFTWWYDRRSAPKSDALL